MSSVVEDDVNNEDAFFDVGLFDDEGEIDCVGCCCCFDGDNEVFRVNELDEGSLISARLRFTPCSTGSNSNERFNDATANMTNNFRKGHTKTSRSK